MSELTPETLQMLRSAETLCTKQLQRALGEDRVRVHSIDSRVKDQKSLAQKFARPDRVYDSLADVTDLLGLRVTTWYEDDIDAVASTIEKTFELDLSHSINKSKSLHTTQFGYSSMHYVCCIPIQGWEVWRFEIQIRTVLQHVWAELEHDLGYKSPVAIPTSARRRFSRLAGLLELVDQEFVQIRQDLESYTTEIASNIESVEEWNALNVTAFAAHNTVQAWDKMVAENLRLRVSGEPFYPDYLARALTAAGLENPQNLLKSFQVLQPELAGFTKLYSEFMDRVFNFSLRGMDSVQPGYSLLLLSQLFLLKSHPLKMTQVDTLTEFYQNIEYADDPIAARQVALELVASADANPQVQ